MNEKKVDIIGYMKISKKLLPSNPQDLVILTARGNRMKECLVDGKSIEDANYLLVDTSKKEYADGDIVITDMFGITECVKIKLQEEITYIMKGSKTYAVVTGQDVGKIQGKVIKVFKIPKS